MLWHLKHWPKLISLEIAGTSPSGLRGTFQMCKGLPSRSFQIRSVFSSMERAMQSHWMEWRALSLWEAGGEERVGALLDGLRFLHLNLSQQKFACCLGAFQSKIQRSRLLSQEILRITLLRRCDSSWALISINPSLTSKLFSCYECWVVLSGSTGSLPVADWIYMGITGGSHFMKSPAPQSWPTK